jgi:hypothetical protein
VYGRRDFLKTSALAGAGLFVPSFAAAASNRISEENARLGTDRWQLYSISHEREVEGYASATSVNVGEPIQFHVHASEPSFKLQIFRLGWYGGLGGRAMTEQITLPSLSQPVPEPDAATGLVECTWQPSLTLTIPADWVSGGYLAKVSAPLSRKETWIPFIVREDDRPSDLLFQSSVTTNHAYNNWGGKSLYEFNSTNAQPAVKVSFNRPYIRGAGAGDFVLRWEYNMIRFLEREGYDVRYITNVDTHARPWLLRTARAFLSVGHDEYWSWEMRENVTAARDQGTHLGFFSANVCYWKIRLESGSDGTPDRTMVGYKERALSSDPMRHDPRLITNTWRHAPTHMPEEQLVGIMYIDSQIDGDIVVARPDHWIFARTGLRNGDRLAGVLGYEVDRVFGAGPPGVEVLTSSPYVRQDNGGTGYSNMTIYAAPGGALVFATGSIQWSWGLDPFNDGRRSSRYSPAAEQITRNVLNRFIGAEPIVRRRGARRS